MGRPQIVGDVPDAAGGSRRIPSNRLSTLAVVRRATPGRGLVAAGRSGHAEHAEHVEHVGYAAEHVGYAAHAAEHVGRTRCLLAPHPVQRFPRGCS